MNKEKLKQLMIKIIKDKRTYGFIFLLFVLVQVFIYVYPRINAPASYEIFSGDLNNPQTVSLNSDNTYTQEFTTGNYSSFQSVTVYVKDYTTVQGATVNMTMYDGKYKVAIGKAELPEDFNTQYITMVVDTVLPKGNEKIVMNLSFENTKDEPVELVSDGTNCKLTLKTNEKNLFQKVTPVILSFLLILIAVLFVWYFYFNLELHHLFLISATVCGLLIALYIPLGSEPDELRHLATSYKYSNIIFNVNEDYSNLGLTYIRNGDYSALTWQEKITSNFVSEYWQDNVFKLTSSDNSITTYVIDILPPSFPYVYYFSAFGIMVGRLLNLGGFYALNLGRLCNFIVFLLTGYYCIKNTKAYKNVFFFVCMLPMTLQQCCSFSYDAIIICLALLVCNQTIRLLTNQKLNKYEKILLPIESVLLFQCKQHAYMFVALFPIIYLIKKYYKNIYKLTRKYLKYIILSLFVLAIIAYLLILKNRSQYSEGSLMYLASHPMTILLILRETMSARLYEYMTSMMNNCMGLYYIQSHICLNVLFIVLLFLHIFIHNNEKLTINFFLRMLILILFLMEIAGIMYGTYSWSVSIGNYDISIIEGIQGRYLIPILPLFMISLIPSYSMNEDAYNVTNYITIIGTIFTVLYLFVYMVS